MTVITSKDNPTVKLASALLTQSRQRKKLGKTVIEGTHLIDAALRAGKSLEVILIGEEGLTHPEVIELLEAMRVVMPQAGSTMNHDKQDDNYHGFSSGEADSLVTQSPSLLILSQPLYKTIRSLGEGAPIMAILPSPASDLPERIDSDCLILNGIQDNGNLGTLLRTAAAVGIEWVLCTEGTASVWSPKTLRAGMGAQFALQMVEHLSIEAILDTIQVPLLATSSHTDRLIYQTDLSSPVAWILGHEGHGVDEAFLRHASAVALPQPNGQESLNVAIAGSLCLYEMLRQRHYAGADRS